MIKTCGKRSSHRVYSHKELEDMVVMRLGWNKTRAKHTTKMGMCHALGIEWVEKEAVVVHPEKVCSDRLTKTYPNRYTKDELIHIIRQINPFMNRNKLEKTPFYRLCALARMPFVRATTRNTTMVVDEKRRTTIKEDGRYYRDGMPEKTETISCIERGVKTPFQYQKRVVDHFHKHRGLIAVHSVGSGKTLTALIASQCYLDEFPTRHVLVISPTSLIANFKKEMAQFGDLRHKDRYEFFSFQGFFYQYKNNPRSCKNHFLIVDEAHNLRTEHHETSSGKETGKINKVVSQCAQMADRILLLTATPLINRNTDVAPLLNMIRDYPTDTNKITIKEFKKEMGDDAYLRKIGLCRFSFYERQRASDDYPRVDEEDVYLTMPQRFLESYRKVEEELMEDEVLRAFGSSKLKPFYNGVRRAVNILSELPDEELIKSPKIKWILSQLRQDKKKTLIFSHFLESGLKSIQRRLPEGVRSAYITGSQSKKTRSKHVDQYNNDELDVLFISKAGGEGIDLKGTRRIILLESGWNENTEAQVIGRGVRFRSHANLPHAEQKVSIYRLYHVKPEERNHIDQLLSPDTVVDYNDHSTWLSADLMLKRISKSKADTTNRFMERLRNLSIERNQCQE